MKKSVSLFIIAILSSTFVYTYGQDSESDIRAIRELYQNALETINNQSKADAAKNQLQVTTQKS